MRAKWICLVLLCLSVPLRAADAPFSMSADEQAIVDLTNAQRQKSGKPSLRPNAVLFNVARKHAADMAAAKKLEHRLHGKNSADRVQAAGYKWTTVSENIAWNQRSVDEVMSGWMRSDGHRTNMLGTDISEIGVGVATNSSGEPYWVQVFARPEIEDREEHYEPMPGLAQPAPAHPDPIGATFKFSIHNVAGEPVNVDVHADKLYVIKPGETVSYTLTSPSPKPPVEIKSGIHALEFIVKSGAKYTINTKGADMELTQSNPGTP